MTRSTAAVERIRQMFADIDSARWDQLGGHFAPNCVYERPGYEPLHGIEALLHFYREVRIITSGKHDLANVIASEEAAASWGRFRGLSRDGRPLDERFADAYGLRNDGLIQTRVSYFFRAAI